MRVKTTDPLLPLWEKASKGDTAALNELAKGVEPWVVKKSNDYWHIFKQAVPADDFISAANAKFLPSVKSFRPGHGRFINYFASNATRAMVDVFEAYQIQLARNTAGAKPEKTIDVMPDEDRHRDAFTVMQAMSWLTAIEREYVKYWTCMNNGRPRDITKAPDRLAKLLNVTIEEAQVIHDELIEKVRRYTERGVRAGRKPDVVTTGAVQLAARRRAEGVRWKEIIGEIRETYGRNYTVWGLEKMVARRSKPK